jgi:hypothetical protein
MKITPKKSEISINKIENASEATRKIRLIKARRLKDGLIPGM